MGFYATDERAAVLESHQENPTPPLKNRVWNFFTTSETCTGFSESQPVELHQEKSPTPTTTASGVRYYGHRQYSPELGRWLSRDPIEDKLVNKFTLPKIMRGYHIDWEAGSYVFVENNPVAYIDYLGLCLINYTCKLTGQSANGLCDKNCEYLCTETSRRDLPYSSGTPCWDVPEPYTFTTTKVARGFRVMSICCWKGSCKDPYDGAGNVGGAGGLDCSKNDCKNKCDREATAAKLACRFTPNPIACRLAVQLAKELCNAGCEMCDNP